MEQLGKPVGSTVTSLFSGLSTQNTLSNRLLYVWKSRVEIKVYSVAYFDRIAAFEAPYR